VTFSTFQFHPQVSRGVDEQGFVEPTPIQQESIPPILGGRDVLGLAQTGTGKTAAFVLPLLHKLMARPKGRVRVLVLAPTRELAEQIHEAVANLGRSTGLRSVTLYGGVAMTPQIDKLRRGVEIAVACPGRLLDHLERRTVDLSQLEVLVLDEADRMLDMGFAPAIRRVLRHVPSARQTLLFSATMPPEIGSLAREILRDPVTVQIGRSAPAETVAHAIFPVDPQRKTALLFELLKRTETGSVLVFTRTKHRASRLGEQLVRAGHAATCLQGNLSQSQRQKALRGFRDGKFRILVATDIASRGIDVTGISHVVNYDMPDTTDAYIHRIGRTGRATRTGDAFTLVTREDFPMVAEIEGVLGTKVERRSLEGFDAGATMPERSPSAIRPAGRAGARPRSKSFPSRRGRARAAW
jgi:ATP-dependent RNA helicase RhlE